MNAKPAGPIYSHDILNISLLFIYLVVKLEKAHCSKSKFLKKNYLTHSRSIYIYCHSPPTLKKLENFYNPFRFQWVLEMKYGSEMDYVVVRVIFVQNSFLDFKFFHF